ncbi:MAG: hypothetical protein HY790_06275 [Deltaproteobacteria bacterium]|nr:hypothetical protein [Deltaproteobacteria bacterium]
MMNEISHDVVYLDLIRHIKQYLDQYKCSFFDMVTEETEQALKKHEGGDELELEEIILLAEHIVDNKYKKAFKDALSKHESIVLPDIIRENITDIEEIYNDVGIYLLYESYYVMRFLDEAPSIIKRAIYLRQIFIGSAISQRVKEFCKEAYKTYINGNFIASVVLLRSIVETVLLERLGIERSELWKLNDLAKEKGLYDIGTCRKVDIIRKSVGNIVHNISKAKLSEEENRKLIILTQDVLSHLIT